MAAHRYPAPDAPLLWALAGGSDLSRPIRLGALVLLAAATAAAAQVSVPLPFTPVPLTLTPMVVLLAGAALGSRLGCWCQLLYLAAGAAGLPVFAAAPLPPGVARLLGPTGGYLLSYPIAAFVAGYFAERGLDRRYLTAVASLLAGLAVIFAGGVLWLAFGVPGIGLRAALAAGLYPFVAMDVVKVCVAAAILPGVWRLVGRRTV